MEDAAMHDDRAAWTASTDVVSGAAPSVHQYTLDNAWAQARRRLELLQQVHDPATVRRLSALGVGAGWRCLVPGAGAGSVARWLCDRVGPTGHVLATDIDTGLLDESSSAPPQLEVRRHDILRDPLPPDSFDLVQVRLLLVHLPEREQVLRRLVAALRPGGWLLAEEYDLFPTQSSPRTGYAAYWRAVAETVARSGADFTWGRQLPGAFQRAGLRAVRADCDVHVFAGASPAAEAHHLSALQLRARLLASGLLSADAFDDVQRQLTDPALWLLGPAMVAAWGQRG
jgi:SAM-dependent methyltransferase